MAGQGDEADLFLLGDGDDDIDYLAAFCQPLGIDSLLPELTFDYRRNPPEVDSIHTHCMGFGGVDPGCSEFNAEARPPPEDWTKRSS